MKFRRQTRLICQPPQAAMLGGVLFLLLFFSLLRAPGVEVDLPGVDTVTSPLSGPVLVVALDANQQIHFRNQPITSSDLRAALHEALRQTGPDLSLIIMQVGRNLSSEAMMKTAHLAREAGVRQIRLVIRPDLFTTRGP